MIVISGDQILYVDVDDTLIMWNPTPEQIAERGIEIFCPNSTTVNEDGEVVNVGGWSAWVVSHRKHIEQIKKHKMRNHTVVVWSQGGFDWAEAAVKALKIEYLVDVVITKPRWIIDDIKPQEFMPEPLWMKDDQDESN